MISLQPREQFTIVRQLSDHTDPSTYYVQAVIRNSISGETIDTLNLNDLGDGRFTKLYEVPSDVSGLGFYIDITTSVYTDEDHTTKAPNYGDSNDQYLVFDRIVKMSGGGGGSDIDYKKIEKMILKAIADIPKMKEMDLTPLLKMLVDLKAGVSGIKIPEPEKMDHTPVLASIEKAMGNLLSAIDRKPVTPATNLKDIDFTSVLDAIKGLDSEKLINNAEKITNAISELQKYLSSDSIQKFAEQLEEIQKITTEYRDVSKTILDKERSKEDSKINRINKLLG